MTRTKDREEATSLLQRLRDHQEGRPGQM